MNKVINFVLVVRTVTGKPSVKLVPQSFTGHVANLYFSWKTPRQCPRTDLMAFIIFHPVISLL